MAKRKQQPSTENDDLYVDQSDSAEESTEVGEDLAALDIAEVFDDEDVEVDDEISASGKRLATKRRLDAYLERKWFRENGWDDDDDLFNDEFFEEDLRR